MAAGEGAEDDEEEEEEEDDDDEEKDDDEAEAACRDTRPLAVVATLPLLAGASARRARLADGAGDTEPRRLERVDAAALPPAPLR